jgi:hypothetical protein
MVTQWFTIYGVPLTILPGHTHWDIYNAVPVLDQSKRKRTTLFKEKKKKKNTTHSPLARWIQVHFTITIHQQVKATTFKCHRRTSAPALVVTPHRGYVGSTDEGTVDYTVSETTRRSDLLEMTSARLQHTSSYGRVKSH